MDPASIIALVGSGLAVVSKIIKNFNDLSHKFGDTKQSTQLLIARLYTLRAALSRLQILLESTDAHSLGISELESDLVAAIRPCVLVINIIDLHVSKINAKGHAKLRYLWNEDIIKEHGLHLDSQISALNLLLQVVQLSSTNAQRILLERRGTRQILQRAQDDALSYLTTSSMSPSSTDVKMKFDFDSQLINSEAYRAAFLKWNSTRRDDFVEANTAISPDEQHTIYIDSASSSTFKADDSDVNSLKRLTADPKPYNWISTSLISRFSSLRYSPRRRNSLVWILVALLLTIVVVAVTVPVIITQTRRSRKSSSNDDSLSSNTTEEPGRIKQPFEFNLARSNTGCVHPETLWSCALPPVPTTKQTEPTRLPIVLEITLRNISNIPQPDPPTLQDQEFIGNTTDNISEPFAGIETSFDTSFSNNASSSIKQHTIGNFNSSTIPPPELNSDGTAASAKLIPSLAFQPLRLYNKGMSDEHYGFYAYYDKSVFMDDLSTENSREVSSENASCRVTFAQTRLHVQIWTNGSSLSMNDSILHFPISVTIDRHGGDATQKKVYVYELESGGRILNDTEKRFFLPEDRTFGGTLVNGAQGRSTDGPIDGGTGGCSCVWEYTPSK